MLSFLSLLLRRKRTIVTAAVAGFVVSVALSLVLPSKYVSTAAFIPGGVEQELTGRSSFLSRLGSFSESYATFIRVGRNFIIDYIIRSNRMAEMMDSRFDLKEMYGKDSIEVARERGVVIPMAEEVAEEVHGQRPRVDVDNEEEKEE